MNSKTRKLDVYKLKDRELIEKLPCAFCGERKISFKASDGYESHFSDSDFECLNCGCCYPVGLFIPDKNLDECKEMMTRRALGYYNQLKKDYLEKFDITTRLKERMKMYEDNFNPSKRDELGK
jgi:hypothetical protein